jgi:hypothetical protein
MRIILAVLILFGSVIASNAACILGMGSDCPLSDSEAEAKIRSAIDGKTLENQTVHLLKIIQNRIDMPGVWQVVSYQYQLGSETRQGYVGFGKCSDGWCIQSVLPRLFFCVCLARASASAGLRGAVCRP